MTTAHALTVRKSITVPIEPARAFELFTARIGEWWPFATHSLNGDEADTAVFEPHEGGRLYERSTSGRENEWARVLAFEPPSRFLLEWQVNSTRPATELEVRFVAEGAGTRVELEHRGWESEERRSSYDDGWAAVLARYAEAAR